MQKRDEGWKTESKSAGELVRSLRGSELNDLASVHFAPVGIVSVRFGNGALMLIGTRRPVCRNTSKFSFIANQHHLTLFRKESHVGFIKAQRRGHFDW